MGIEVGVDIGVRVGGGLGVGIFGEVGFNTEVGVEPIGDGTNVAFVVGVAVAVAARVCDGIGVGRA